MNLKPYPEYKDSGVEWIGEIPDSWETHRFKINFKYIKGRIPENLKEEHQENSIPYLSMDYLRGNESDVLYSENDPKAIEVNEGDLLLLWDGSNAGEFVEGKKGYLSSTMVKLLLENIDLKYSNYLCRAFEQLLRDLTIGMGIPHVNGDNLGNIRITHPNIEEQKAIVSFLDKKTSEIDKTIEKDTRLIELLQEKRTALINHVVTKGLDPEAPMKYSGIEWIGKMPEHWELGIMGADCVVKARLGWRGLKASEYVDDGYIFLSTPNIKNREIDFKSVNYITPERYFESPEIMLNVGDVLLAKDGSTLGICNVVRYLPSPSTVNSSIAVIKPKTINGIYLHYFISSQYMQNIIQKIKDGMGVPHLFQADIRRFKIFKPPLSEQNAIGSYLDIKTSEIDEIIQKIQIKIQLLQEYKKSLIHHVVTGKVDVRDVV